MKQWFFLFLLSFSFFAFSAPLQEHTIDPEALSQLALKLEISKEADLIKETQKRWLRKPGQERWELGELSVENRSFVLDWARKQKLFDPWKPSITQYDKALILGATTGRMQMRLQHLKELWNQGIRFDKVVWLTGDRPLDPRVDSLTDRCQNESEAAVILWQETELPQELRSLPVAFVAVPMKKEGSFIKRPNTQDTLVAWLKEEPAPCKALFVSDQPFCGYQFAVIQSSLPDSFSFDVVGPGAENAEEHPAAAAIVLDSIARWIYQENQ